MSNMNLEQSICKAIELIADKKISQAGYDITITGYVKKCLDASNGKYLIKYEDNQFQAYASANLYLEEGQQVSILIPERNWDRTKTIIGATKAYAANFNSIEDDTNKFNQIGKNIISYEKGYQPATIKISSYEQGIHQIWPSYTIINESGQEQIVDYHINVDQNAAKEFITKGNGINISNVIQTSFDVFQTGGIYGVIFDLEFLDDVTKDAAVQSYIVSSLDFNGNPYTVIKPTLIQKTFNEIKTSNFNRIAKISVFSKGFKIQDVDKAKEIKDIAFSDFCLLGAEVLSQDQLNGYTLHINYGQNESGNRLKSDTEKVIFKAELKSKGNIITDGVEYYWFRENALVFNGHQKYCNKGGNGWECLNNYDEDGKVLPLTSNIIQFVKSENDLNKYKVTVNIKNDNDPLVYQNTDPLTVFLPQKTTKIRCIAVKGLIEIEGFEIVINENIDDIIIQSSDKIEGIDQNRVDYYRDSGSPTLTCLIKDFENKEVPLYNNQEQPIYDFSWSIITNRGDSIQVTPFIDTDNQLASAKNNYEKLLDQYNRTDKKSQQEQGQNSIKHILEQAELTLKTLDIPRADKNIYYHFPIKDIYESSRIICTVRQIKKLSETNEWIDDDTYKGSASITLYNHMQLQDTYSLIIENSSQVFHYDAKGTSPASNQIQKPITILPLSFKLFDNQGNEISYQQIVNNGYIRWLLPKNNTLLMKDDRSGDPLDERGFNSETFDMKGDDIDLAADFYIYKDSSELKGARQNLSSFFFSIAPSFDEKKTVNYIRLDIKYQDMYFSAYTNFSFPKQGDPGTNGTDLFARLVPIDNSNEELSGRVYAEITPASTIGFFNEEGYSVKGFKFLLYNNGSLIENLNDNIYWTCPPEINQKVKDKDPQTTHLRSEKSLFDIQKRDNIYGDLSFKNFTNTRNATWKLPTQISTINDYLPIDIVRGQYGDDPNNIKYFAEYPVCYCYVKDTKYRIKLKPKSGFDYVVYKDDGTSPDYDNTLPFEVIVQELEHLDGNNTKEYYFNIQPEKYEYIWSIVGDQLQIQEEEGLLVNQKNIKPIDTMFNSSIMYNAIICQVKDIGFIHIPIYMITNRYGHGALNSWDGSSIELGQKEIVDKDGNVIGYEPTGTILAPQVGAGRKDLDTNSFTGIIIGQEQANSQYDKYNYDSPQITSKNGLFGYHKGERTIFLDSQTGKAEFGKSGAARVILNPTLRMVVEKTREEIDEQGNITPATTAQKDCAFIYSDNFRTLPQDDDQKDTNKKSYITNSGKLQNENGSYINYQKVEKEGGMMLDLTSPQIAFANGKFSVDKDGRLHSVFGDIAGWIIDDNKLYKHHEDGNWTGMASGVWKVSDIGGTLPTLDNTVAFYAGTNDNHNNFYVTHTGFLFSRNGNIAGWGIDSQKIAKTRASYQVNKIDKQGQVIQIKQTQDDKGNIIREFEKEEITVNAVGMNSDPTNLNWDSSDNKGKIVKKDENGNFVPVKDNNGNQIKCNIHLPKAFRAESSKGIFYVTHDGFLRSTSGQIAYWNIDSKRLTDGQVGMGHLTFNKSNPFKVSINARFWAASEDLEVDVNDNAVSQENSKNLNFAVSSTGGLFSKFGRIGGWQIGENTLKSWNSGIEIYAGAGNGKTDLVDDQCGGQASGWLRGYDGSAVSWQISNNGSAYFRKGTIAGWTITDDHLQGGNTYINKDGSMGSTDWSIDANGNAHFNYIYGKIAKSDGSPVSLIGGDGTGTGTGGYKLDSGGGFSMGNSGANISNTGGNGLAFTTGQNTWHVQNGMFFCNDIQTGLILHDKALHIGKTASFTEKSITLNNHEGKTGQAVFSDGSWLKFEGGICIDWKIVNASNVTPA